MTQLNGKIEWAVYNRTGGGYIATPDPKSAIRRYCWITGDGVGWYKEMGQPPVLLGHFRTINDVVQASRKLG